MPVCKGVKPGVSHAWGDMKEQGILCRKGLLTHTHTCLRPSFFILSVLTTLSFYGMKELQVNIRTPDANCAI